MAEEIKKQEAVAQAIVAPAQEAKKESYLSMSFDVLGYKIPYWVLVVLGVLLLYFLYQRGTFNGVLGRESVMIADRSVLAAPTGVTDGVQTPEVVRRLINLRV